jgi:hypothetical protein
MIYFCSVELHIRILAGSARLGVRFIYDYQAKRAYEDLIRFENIEHQLLLEPGKQTIDLCLTSINTGEKTWYKSLVYKKVQLLKFQQWQTEGSEITFVHIYSKHNTLHITRPSRTDKFVRITSTELRLPENF